MYCRFLPHKNALKALRNNWYIYLTHFQNQKARANNVLAAKASSWLDNLMSCEFMMKTRVYEHIVALLSRTAHVFQADKAQSVADAFIVFKTLKAEQVRLVLVCMRLCDYNYESIDKIIIETCFTTELTKSKTPEISFY